MTTCHFCKKANVDRPEDSPYSDDAGNRLPICHKCERAKHAAELARHPYTPRMEALCQSIRCLRGMAGASPWDPVLLAEQYGPSSGGEGAAIAFVLNVWNNHPGEWEKWGVPPFTIREFSRMDDENQAAVAKWFAEPFYP